MVVHRPNFIISLVIESYFKGGGNLESQDTDLTILIQESMKLLSHFISIFFVVENANVFLLNLFPDVNCDRILIHWLTTCTTAL
jgi:hypothetical protein